MKKELLEMIKYELCWRGSNNITLLIKKYAELGRFFKHFIFVHNILNQGHYYKFELGQLPNCLTWAVAELPTRIFNLKSGMSVDYHTNALKGWHSNMELHFQCPAVNRT